ncbi:MAG: AMP-binding protein [Halieaceae bacterium]|nr:AMP-binding protein [Halieaceae bacterium]
MIDTEKTYLHVLFRRAEETPDKMWMQDVCGDELTFAQSRELALKWANALQQSGVGEGDMVATMMENCLDSQHVWLGAALIQGIEVPLSPLLRGESLVHALNDSRSRVIVVADQFHRYIEDVADRLEHLERIVILQSSEKSPESAFGLVTRRQLIGQADVISSFHLPQPKDIACVLYTSGTTGPSKGVLITWGQLNSIAASIDVSPFDDSDAYYYTGASNHIPGRSQPLWMASLGGRFVMRPSFRTQDFWADIDQYACTLTLLIGAMAHFLMSEPVRPDDRSHSLNYVLMAPVLPNVEQFNQRFGVVTSTGYNMTETSNPIMALDWKIVSPESCGRLREGWPYYEARLVDENDEDVPVGKAGELLLRTKAPHTMNAGYLNRPDATEEAWRGGWFHTGDVLQLDANGNYYFIDRRKDAIRKSGENVSSFEVEMQIAAHAHVAECAAIAVPADNIEDEIKVFLVPAEGCDIDPEDVVKFAAEMMPRYMVPRYIEIISELPKTHTMRVQKAKLRDLPRTNEWDRVAAGIDIKRRADA